MQGIRFGGGFIICTEDEAPGAWPNGTRVAKTGTLPGDSHPDGALATVRGSMSIPDLGVSYFVEWDDTPGFPVLVRDCRVRRAP